MLDGKSFAIFCVKLIQLCKYTSIKLYNGLSNLKVLVDICKFNPRKVK